MRQVTTEHYLSHLYGAIKTNKTLLDQINVKIQTLKANDSAESDKKALREMVFQQAQFYIVIVLLTNSMIEALANHYLANKCDDAERFEVLERLSTLEKLVVAPKFFVKEYKFPKSEALYSDLKHLFTLRSSWVHPKPKIVVNGHTVHKGNLAKTVSASTLTPDKCVSLPFRFVEHLCLYDHGAAFELAVYSGFSKEDVNQIALNVQTKSLKQKATKRLIKSLVSPQEK